MTPSISGSAAVETLRSLSFGHSLMAQQCVDLWLSAAKGFERIHGAAAAAGFEDRLAVLASGLDAGLAVGARCFLERRVGVGAQHLGPLVAVVAGRIAAREDVAEGVGRATE